jgi:predicted amidohydrolase YtcJ
MLIADVRIAGFRGAVDVRCTDSVIAAIGPSLPRVAGEEILQGCGGTLLPGLHDHHIHLMALAALDASVNCGPPAVSSRAQLAQALRSGYEAGWLRGVGYHESVAGELDRWQLDALVSDRPTKIQHRSGKLWIVNSSAAQRLRLDEHIGLPGIELDVSGKPNGRLFRLDHWMRTQLQCEDRPIRPSLARVSRQLASYGVTGITDATPDNGADTMQYFASAAASGELLQDVRVMGMEGLPDSGCPQVQRGELKVLLDEDSLPDWDTLLATFGRAHREGRAVAVHCVTPTELVLTLSVLRALGPQFGDRIEHGSLIPTEVLPLLREVGVTVITQPGFVCERGDQYLQAIAPGEHDDLYRCHTLLAQGIPLAGSTDAPYGDCDPWAAMRAAVHRFSRAGAVIGAAEQLSPEQALALFTSSAADPGGVSRRIAVGAAADFCLLDCSWEDARIRLLAEDVRATVRQGNLIYLRELRGSTDRDNAIVAA